MSLFHSPTRPSPRGAGTALLVALLLDGCAAQADPRQRPIRGGEPPHTLDIELAAGEFLGIVVEQEGIDLFVELLGPDGRPATTVDSTDDWFWEEELAWVAERPGTHRLVIRPLLPRAAGSYRLRQDGPRPARPEDLVRVEAVREMRAAHADYGKRGTEAAQLAHLERALPLWRRLGERRREAEVLHQIGGRLFDLGRRQESAERYHQAVDVWQELGLPDRRAWSLLAAGRLDHLLLREEEALGHLEEGLAFAERSGIRELEVEALYRLGCFHASDPRTAVRFLEPALRLARDLGYELVEMRALHYLGNAYDDLALKQEALRSYEKALEIAGRLGDSLLAATTLNNMGLLYDDLGDTERAISSYEEALAVRGTADDDFHATVLNNQARALEKVDPARARELYGRTLELGRKSGARHLQAAALNNLALLDLGGREPASALRRSQEALRLAAGHRDVEIDVRRALGLAHRELGHLEPARRELKAALDLSRERQDGVRESRVIPALARTERDAGNPRGALDLLDRGVEILERVRAQVVAAELRTSFLASRQDIYELRTDTLMALHRAHPDHDWDERALGANEQARARGLIDLIAEAGADVRKEASQDLVERERRLLAEIAALDRRRLELLDGGDPRELAEIGRRLEAALKEHRDAEAALLASSPRYSGLTRPRPLSVDEIRREVLDGRALLLEYALGQDRSYLWAVGPDSLRSFDLPPREKIEKAARRWYDALQESAASADEARQAADELGAMLLGPVQELLSGQPLLIVADGALQYLPFAALPLAGPGRVLVVDRHEVTSLPSASALAVLRRELAGRSPAPKTLAVLADPVFRMEDQRVARNARRGGMDPRRLERLHFSKEEADAIAGLVPEPQRFKALGFAASRDAVVGGKLAPFRMVHIASHGLIDSRRPELSTIVLSLVDERGKPQNGFLRLHDVYNLELQADLVTLSACRTALGREIRGEGLVGLTRGFMYAGSARVLASLWSVDDRATSVLMKSFYRHMISGGLSPAAALRRAQSEMAHSQLWSSPFYWAGFSLQGEWR